MYSVFIYHTHMSKISTTPKINYFTHALSHTFMTHRPFYFLWKPINMNCYSKLKQSVGDGSKVDRSVGMIEQSRMFGRGRIGVASEQWDWTVEGEFGAVEILGDYAQMKTIYPQIMKENPNAREYYTVYLNDPAEVSIEEQKTWILFR